MALQVIQKTLGSDFCIEKIVFCLTHSVDVSLMQ